MSKLGLSLLAGSMFLLPSAALSQEGSAQTADDFVCALTGECGGEEAQTPATTDTNQGRRPRVGATRGFSLDRPSQERQPRQATPPRQRPQQTATRPSTRRPAAQQQVGRVDLRVNFETGSSTLTADAYPVIRAFAEALKRPQLADSRIRIEGHTDSSGGRALNMDLSQRRAQSVAQFLISEGVTPDRLDVQGYGYDRPLPGHSASSGANRRVEAVRITSG